MRVSEHYKLGRHQGELDFVDVDVENDTRLYVDPRALRLLPTEWGQRCVSLIQNFFRRVMVAIRDGDDELAIRLLAGLTEPNETHLGLSRGRSKGTGLGPGLARETWESLSESEAAKSGLLIDLEDTALMVELIDRDRVSDIATNIIREPLIEYTQAMSEHYGIPIEEGVASGAIWDPRLEEWHSGFVELPVTKPAGPLLLVPKVIVRQKLDYDQSEYFNHYMLPFMQSVEIAAGSSLVTLLKDGTPRVTKKDLKEHYGTGKATIVKLTREHPEALENYREAKKNRPQQPLDHPVLGEEVGDEPPDWDELLADVVTVKPGKPGATDYHHAVERLLSALFYPSLAHPDLEHGIHDGRKFIDISYANVADHGFFAFVAKHYPAAHIVVECKNYTGDPKNPELDQLAGRFSKNRGEVGLLLCRTLEDKELFLKRCRDTMQDGRGLIIPLDDEALKELIASRGAYSREGDFALLRERYEYIVS